MKMQVVVIRDIVADVYGVPQFVPNLGSAIRSFGDQCQNKERGNTLGEHPEDFEMYHLGEYDDKTAEFTDINGGRIDDVDMKQIATGANYRRS